MVPSYIISDAPDKGRGLFAMRDIRIGELIIAEAPLFTASSPMGIMRAVNRLSAVDRARLDDLSDVYSPSAPKPMTIFKTDAMPLGSGSLEGETIYAVKPIRKDQEILTAYFHPAASRSDRLAEIEARFNFTCRCTACAGHINAASDIRRAKIADLDDRIMITGARDPVAGYKMAKERLRLMDQEGMADHSEKSRTHYDAFQTCLVVSDFAAAKRHAGLAYGGRVLCEGPESDATRQDSKFYRRPNSHAAAGMKGRRPMPMICETCGLEAKLTCRCGCAVYCDAECQLENAKWHDAVCEVIRNYEMTVSHSSKEEMGEQHGKV